MPQRRKDRPKNRPKNPKVRIKPPNGSQRIVKFVLDGSSQVAPAVQARNPLVELPTELLDSICQSVSQYVKNGERFPDHPQDLIHLGRTCRRMYRVVQQTLYREIVAGRTGDGRPRRVNLGDLVCPFPSAKVDEL